MRADLSILLAAGLGGVIAWPRMPEAAGVGAPVTAFSAGRAMAHVRDWSTEPRPTGSAAHAAVLDSLDHELSASGFDVQRQTPGALVNLVASAPGADADGDGRTDLAIGAPGDATAGGVFFPT